MASLVTQGPSLGSALPGCNLGTALQELLCSDDIMPGSAPGYQTCKTIYTYHPLGAKIAEYPVKMAQSQKRKLTIQDAPEDDLVEAFEKEWEALSSDRHLGNLAALSRVYGISSIALLVSGKPTNEPVDYEALHDATISFNVLDPLNTAGSLVLNQDPNSMDFMKVGAIAVAGQSYHRSRSVTLMWGNPVYIEYTTSAFGFVGRSVYQQALMPLKSFINTLVTDDLIAKKAGLLVAMIKAVSSITDQLASLVGGIKRALLKEAEVGNVIQIGHEDKVESLNLQNLEGPYALARKNILENIASGAGCPAQIINAETFAAGFGEGAEDAKKVAQSIQGIREWMQPGYAYFDKIVQYRAWNTDFYKTLQRRYPEQYKDMSYEQAFAGWQNSFLAVWPSLIEEPESEKVGVADVKLKAMIAITEVLLPALPPGEQKAKLIQWLADNINSDKVMFSSPLELDYDEIAAYEPPQPEEGLQEPKPEAPFSSKDSASLPNLQRRLALASR
jgi:hypothetical protein